MKNESRSAFTLIELLIVVAIIAILAAIAVPNLLEAQTRAKVSRTKSDLRTVGQAIRAYEGDNNGRPPAFAGDKGLLSGDFYYWWIWLEMGARRAGVGRFLTSPISYLSAPLPPDVFNPSTKGQS